MKKRAAKRTRFESDTSLLKHLEKDEDTRSLDNNTNLNWGAPKRKLPPSKFNGTEFTLVHSTDKLSVRVGEDQIEEIDAQEFYTSGHYFIDQLKEEYCSKNEEGWYKLKEAIGPDYDAKAPLQPAQPKESKIVLPQGCQYNSGKWSKKEHQRFLEGLRRFGKDWPRVTAFIKSRDIKSVISQGQKFLVRLVNFLERDELVTSLEGISKEEAEYFFGVLSKRNHWSRLKKEEKDRVIEENKAKGFLFHVAKVKHQGDPMDPLIPVETESTFQKWKEEIFGQELSYHKSLGFSVKVLPGGSCQDGSRLVFKSKISFEDDDDSAASQSSKHMRRFNVDGNETKKGSEDLYFQVVQKFIGALSKMRDLTPEEVDSNVEVKIRMPSGEVFNFIHLAPSSMLMSKAFKPQEWSSIAETKPNLIQHIDLQFKQRIDEQGFAEEQNEHQSPLTQYFERKTREDMDRFLEDEVVFFIQQPGQEASCSLAELKSSDVEKTGDPELTLDRINS